MRTIFLFIFLGFSNCLVACLTSEVKEDDAVVISAKTVLPKKFRTGQQTLPLPSQLIIPQLMVRVSYINRPRAEVRVGPGVRFRVNDQVLTEGEKVIVFKRIGVWQKVLVLKTGARGWIHHQALAVFKKK